MATTTKRIYRDAEGKRLLPEGHAAAAFLHRGIGQTVEHREFEGWDTSALKGYDYLDSGEGDVLIEASTPSVPDAETIDPELSDDVHAPLHQRSSATDKAIANRDTGLYDRLGAAPGTAGGQHATTPREVIEGSDRRKKVESGDQSGVAIDEDINASEPPKPKRGRK